MEANLKNINDDKEFEADPIRLPTFDDTKKLVMDGEGEDIEPFEGKEMEDGDDLETNDESKKALMRRPFEFQAITEERVNQILEQAAPDTIMRPITSTKYTVIAESNSLDVEELYALQLKPHIKIEPWNTASSRRNTVNLDLIAAPAPKKSTDPNRK